MQKVTGIGGIFFKSKNLETLNNWYAQHLGLPVTPYGATFEAFEDAEGKKPVQTQWSAFAENTPYFQPSEKEFMINYRVADLEALVQELKQNGVQLLGEIEAHEYGKFIHVLDPEGNKIELWEPAS